MLSEAAPVMKVYKFTPDLEIAKQISIAKFRFYELIKYVRMEDDAGRADPKECSVSFPENEYGSFPEKLPVGKFQGIEFRCISTSTDEEYMKQYFVFCMSTRMDKKAIGDSLYAVELYRDTFDLFSLLLNRGEGSLANSDGNRFFSHGNVDYYDIHRHPEPFIGQRWREVFVKHSDFEHQSEYRAALFASDHFFRRIRDKPMLIEKRIYKPDGESMNFNLKLSLRSGIDGRGWRYIEFDLSEFAANMSAESRKIISLSELQE